MSAQSSKHHIVVTSKKICREIGEQLGVEYDAHALDLIAEMALKKLSYYAVDLEAFQKHAKRSTITSDDVKLLVRRNNSLKQLVEDKCNVLQTEKPTENSSGVKRKRKTVAAK